MTSFTSSLCYLYRRKLLKTLCLHIYQPYGSIILRFFFLTKMDDDITKNVHMYVHVHVQHVSDKMTQAKLLNRLDKKINRI